MPLTAFGGSLDKEPCSLNIGRSSRPRTEIIVYHVNAVVIVSVIVILVTFPSVKRIRLAPVEHHVVEELTVDELVVVSRILAGVTHAVETRRTAVAVGYQAVVHRTVFATPLRCVCTHALGVFRCV